MKKSVVSCFILIFLSSCSGYLWKYSKETNEELVSKKHITDHTKRSEESFVFDVYEDSYDGQILLVKMKMIPMQTIDSSLLSLRVRVLDDAVVTQDQKFSVAKLIKSKHGFKEHDEDYFLANKEYNFFVTIHAPKMSSYQAELIWGDLS